MASTMKAVLRHFSPVMHAGKIGKEKIGRGQLERKLTVARDKAHAAGSYQGSPSVGHRTSNRACGGE